jgi:hypothetical protein
MLTNELGIGVRGLVASCGYYRSSYSNQQIYGMCYSGFFWGVHLFLDVQALLSEIFSFDGLFSRATMCFYTKCLLSAEIAGVFLLLIS